MNKVNMYCLSLYDEDYDKIKNLGYTPVGLGKKKFSESWLRDNQGINISEKNEFYGEYTFHYWLWKNKINEMKDGTWTGFCAYRRFWLSSKKTTFTQNHDNFLTRVPDEWENYDAILGQQFFINKMKFSKLLKHSMRSLISYPPAIFEKNRNIRFHFNSFHGFGKLDKAIDLLNDEDREDFREFTIKNTSYNMGNMFICKSKKIITMYYESIFPWLKKCENTFGLKSGSYGETRIYGFLAERYLSYWFNKYAKTLTWPIVFFDINSNRIK